MTAMNVPTASVPDRRTISAALELASRAPSVHNTQPWRWVVDGEHLHLYADTDRLLTAADPRGRQLVISCGAVLHHARTVFGARGWHTDTERLPNPLEPGHLAEIRFRPWPDPPAGLVARAGVIDRRRTDRLPMAEPPDFEALLRRLRMLVSPHYLELDALEPGMVPRLAAATQQTAALRHHDMQYQAEIGWWAGHSGMPEGIPADALISDAEAARVSVGRPFPSAPHSARRADIDDAARLVVLSSTGDSPIEWLRTGEALSAVLLECTVAGLATCALTHVTEMPSARTVLTGLVPRTGKPQVAVRIGAAPDDEHPARTPRRPLQDTLTFTG